LARISGAPQLGSVQEDFFFLWTGKSGLTQIIAFRKVSI